MEWTAMFFRHGNYNCPLTKTRTMKSNNIVPMTTSLNDIELSTIFWGEVLNKHYVKIFTEEKVYFLQSSIKKLLQAMPKNFLKANNAQFVNKQNMIFFDREKIIMKMNEVEIPIRISTKKRKQVLTQLNAN